MLEELTQELYQLILPLFEVGNLDLVDLKVLKRGRDLSVEILTDRPSGGITLGECGSINKEVVALIEEESFFETNYDLMVCSPGLDWMLKTEKDFLRNIGREVRIFLQEPVEDKQEYVGTIDSICDNNVVIICSDQQSKKKKKVSDPVPENKEIRVPLNKVNKATLII